MCRVLNKHAAGRHDGAIYIGRGSKWGNPFRIGVDGDRATVIAKHARWLRDQHHLLRALDELRGKDLLCFCAPAACHGDLLLRLATRHVKSASPGGAQQPRLMAVVRTRWVRAGRSHVAQVHASPDQSIAYSATAHSATAEGSEAPIAGLETQALQLPGAMPKKTGSVPYGVRRWHRAKQ